MSQHRRAIAASLGSLTLTAGLLAAASPSTAAEQQTCQGQPATIVGSGTVVGTEGPDVIVATGPDADVKALGGDDVICVTGSGKVDAGPGNDVVDTTGKGGSTSITVDLGAGEDRLLGGPGSETVTADAEGSAEDDVIDTGAGSDYVDSGTDGFPNGDVIALGPESDRDDHVRLRATRFTGEVDGGAGVLRLTVGDTEGSFTVDAANAQVHRDGQPWTPLKGEFRFFQVRRSAGLVFQGSDRDERLSIGPAAGGATSVDLGGGDDGLNVYGALREGDVVDGGAGEDSLAVRAEEKGASLELDLATGAFDSSIPGAGAASATARGFEGGYLKAHRLTVRATPGDDGLLLTGCKIDVEGREGDDSIGVEPDLENDETRILDCSDPVARIDGGPGNDKIASVDNNWFRGSDGDDRLRGGPGNDEIRGYGGNDRIWGGQGRDKIWGGDGRDKIWGGKGRDRIRGNNGHDRIWGGKGPDTLEGGKGRDQVWGNGGRDLLKGQKHNDRLWGGGGPDEARGGPGADLCRAEKKRGCER